MPEKKISDDRITEIVTEYIESQGKEVISIEINGVIGHSGKIIKIVKVQVLGEEWLTSLGVTDDEEIMDLPLL